MHSYRDDRSDEVYSSTPGPTTVGSTSGTTAEIAAAVSAAIDALIAELPTTDPEIEGAVWNDEGVLKSSADA